MDATATVDDRRVLFSALSQLPPRQRAAVVLRHFDDLSEAATAELLGCSAGTVKSQAARGLAKLRQLITEAPSPPPPTRLHATLNTEEAP